MATSTMSPSPPLVSAFPENVPLHLEIAINESSPESTPLGLETLILHSTSYGDDSAKEHRRHKSCDAKSVDGSRPNLLDRDHSALLAKMLQDTAGPSTRNITSSVSLPDELIAMRNSRRGGKRGAAGTTTTGSTDQEPSSKITALGEDVSAGSRGHGRSKSNIPDDRDPLTLMLERTTKAESVPINRLASLQRQLPTESTKQKMEKSKPRCLGMKPSYTEDGIMKQSAPDRTLNRRKKNRSKSHDELTHSSRMRRVWLFLTKDPTANQTQNF
jgi:hypothetical protein